MNATQYLQQLTKANQARKKPWHSLNLIEQTKRLILQMLEETPKLDPVRIQRTVLHPPWTAEHRNSIDQALDELTSEGKLPAGIESDH